MSQRIYHGLPFSVQLKWRMVGLLHSAASEYVTAGSLGHPPCKNFYRQEQFHGKVAAWLGSSTHTVDGDTIVRSDCLCDRRGL